MIVPVIRDTIRFVEPGGLRTVNFAPRHAIYILLAWFCGNLLFLDRFPFVHSDEIWLGGLTRAMTQNASFAVTEPFFDLQPRDPHALRILFHAGQALSLGLFGFTVPGLRFFPLACGAAGLWFFYRLLRAAGMPESISIAGMALLSLDSQYLYASHFGRQEMAVTAFMLAGLWQFHADARSGVLRAARAGMCAGLALGVHPNALIAALPVALLFVGAVVNREKPVREGVAFAGSAAISALVFIVWSFSMNPDFTSDYLDFGRSVGLRPGLAERLSDFPGFIMKLFGRVSGTYYTPEIRPQLLLISLAMILAPAAVARSFAEKRAFRTGWTSADKTCAAGLYGTVAGIFVLGKFSQPSILFLIPFLYVGLASIASRHVGRSVAAGKARIPIAMLCVLPAVVSVVSVTADIRRETESYGEFQRKLAPLVPPGTRTLGNLSWGIPLGTERLLDIRDLAYLESSGMGLPEYVEKNGIGCIVVSEELDFIYASRPVWNVMYGNPARWYPDLRKFLAERCVPAGEFASPGYGMRIVSRRYKRDWSVRVYLVTEAEIAR